MESYLEAEILSNTIVKTKTKCYSTKYKTLNILTGRIRIRISLGTEVIKLFDSDTCKYIMFNDLNNHFRKCYGKNVEYV